MYLKYPKQEVSNTLMIIQYRKYNTYVGQVYNTIIVYVVFSENDFSMELVFQLFHSALVVFI